MLLGRRYDDHFVPWWVEEGREAEFMESTPYVRAIWMWKYMVRCCHDFFSRPEVHNSGRVMLLRYEDLVTDAHPWGRAVIEHFGAEPRASSFKKMKQAYNDSIGKYRRRDPAEIRAAEEIAGAELTLYGYL